MIYKRKPSSFSPVFDVVGCFVEFNGKILLLKRNARKLQPEKWGIPTGKVDPQEKLINAMIRELSEETGITVTDDKLEFFKTIYVNHGFDFSYHMYLLLVKNKPTITLSKTEHTAFKWVPIEKSLKSNLVDDLDECIKMQYGSIVE